MHLCKHLVLCNFVFTIITTHVRIVSEPIFFVVIFFFFSSRRRHTRLVSDWSSDVCSSDLTGTWANGIWCPWTRLPPMPARMPTTLARRWGSAGQVQAACSGCPLARGFFDRSEERRVGKEGRCRWWPDH